MCCVFLLGCIWITVFTINNIFDMILVTNIYSKYHYYNFLSSFPTVPYVPYVHVFDLACKHATASFPANFSCCRLLLGPVYTQE